MAKAALLLLDFINDIANPNGKIASSAPYIVKYDIINKVNTAIHIARQKGILVLPIKVGFSSNYVECPSTSPIFNRIKQLQALELNTWGTEFLTELNIEETDPVIVKHRISALYATSLEAILHANEIKYLYISGVSTDMAVQTTARDAHDRDYTVTIIEDTCAAGNEKLHNDTIDALSRFTTIIKVDNFA